MVMERSNNKEEETMLSWARIIESQRCLYDLVESGCVVVDCNPFHLPNGETTVAVKRVENTTYLEPLFGLFVCVLL